MFQTKQCPFESKHINHEKKCKGYCTEILRHVVNESITRMIIASTYLTTRFSFYKVQRKNRSEDLLKTGSITLTSAVSGVESMMTFCTRSSAE